MPFARVKERPGGRVFDDEEITVMPAEAGHEARLQVGDGAMVAELHAVAAEPMEHEVLPGYPFRLISRRMHAVMNTTGRNNSRQLREAGANTGLFSSVEHEYDPHSGIPRMSAIPVRVSRGA